MSFRTESDLLGSSQEIPAEVYWGIHTWRAQKNFPRTGIAVNPALIQALAQVKRACAMTNYDLHFIQKDQFEAIVAVCDEIISGQWLNQFPVDGLQGGAGTSLNMNMNEVIANRASERLGGPLGAAAWIHSIEDINLHQSTNDVYPTAIRVASVSKLQKLAIVVTHLQGVLQKKEKEWAAILKVGRTELQEAVPMTLGMECSAWAEAIGRDRWRIHKCQERLRVVNLGGTAIGTGLTAPTEYIFQVVDRLREITRFGFARGENLVSETANADAFVEVSGILKAHATNLIKISSDLRILNLLGEIQLQPLQAGSSMMPGKINPVLLEMASQIALKVIANDFLVTEAVSRGHLQIHEFLPLVAHAFLESLDLLTGINERLAEHFDAITAQATKCRSYLEASLCQITAFLPSIGYEKSTALLNEYKLQLSPDKSGCALDFKEFLKLKLGDDCVNQTLNTLLIDQLGYSKS